MIARTFALLACLALPLPLASSSAPQSDLEALVGDEVASASSKDVGELWKRALELRDAAPLGDKGELDRALDGWLARADEISPQATLLLAASRLLGSGPDSSRLAEALVPLLEAGDIALAAGAAGLLADKSFKSIAPKRRDGFAQTILARAEDGALAPNHRLDFARAAYRLGGGRERIKANRVLRSFLDSQDAELRAQGALAMAELDAAVIEGPLRKALERLSRVPDARGQLAASYLKREDRRRQDERSAKNRLERDKRGTQDPDLIQFLTVLALIQNRHLDGKKVDKERLFLAAINGMLHYMDQHSNLFTSEDYARFFGELEAEYGGIGAYVNEDPDDKLFTIVRPIYSGPAYHTGLMTDDKIVRIGDWPTINQPTDDIIKRLKGKPKTPVDLYIWRHGMDPNLIERPTEDMKVTVVRDSVRIPPGTFQMLPGNIGLLQLDEFSQVAMSEARSWIKQMLGLGMESMILDLRFNGGGLLTAARDVAELFLPAGKRVVSTEGPDHTGEMVVLEKLDTEALKQILPEDMPLVVLVGPSTASAAEIVSGALQDHGRAKLVGKTTYGKGSVQQLIKILPELEDRWRDEDGDGMRDSWEEITLDRDGDGEMDYSPRVKLTVAHYKLPSGRSIHRVIDREGRVIEEGGVEPDVIIDSPLIEGWRVREQRRIRKTVKRHVDETFEQNHELYTRLSLNDMRQPELYPGFDELRAKLGTDLPDNDIRRVLRYEVRRRVQDERGAQFPYGDFVEDVQLQKAIELALEPRGQKPDDISEFTMVFDLPEPTTDGEIRLANRDSEDLRQALTVLRDARTGGRSLSGEEVDRLIEIIGTIDTRKKN